MIILSVLLSAVLDMSLPEFQPEVDLSGNYIIGEFDVSEDDFDVTETGELPDGLTAAALALHQQQNPQKHHHIQQ